MSTESVPRIVPVEDERSPLAREALELIAYCIGDVQPVNDLLSEVEERRRGMPTGGDYHLLAMLDAKDAVTGAAAGIYLSTVNAGFVTYLAVRPELRGQRLGRHLRRELVNSVRAEAQRKTGADPAWMVGEVRRESPWLRTLVSARRAIPFDFPYFHPWMPLRSEGRYVLYRQPLADPRTELPSDEVVGLVYAIWRRAYRIRFPLQSETFRYMMDRLQAAGTIGADPEFAVDPPT